MPRTEIFVPEPPGGCEWVTVDDARQLEKMLAAGSKRIPLWTWPIRVVHIAQDDDGPRSVVDAPWIGSHGFVIKASARSRLRSVFGRAAQYVPVAGTPYRRLSYVHVHNLADVLDEGRSEIVRFSPGPDILDIVRHEFLPSVAQAGPVFKLKQMPRGCVYLTGETVASIASSGLTGFAFKKVWEG